MLFLRLKYTFRSVIFFKFEFSNFSETSSKNNLLFSDKTFFKKTNYLQPMTYGAYAISRNDLRGNLNRYHELICILLSSLPSNFLVLDGIPLSYK